MIKGYKVMLLPNNKQKTKLFECASVSRFIYNWALWYEQTYYKFGYGYLNDGELRKILTHLKKSNEKFMWLNNYSNNITKQSIKDLCGAFNRFFNGESDYPKYKKKRETKPSFYVDTAKIIITATHVKLEKLTDSKKQNKQKFNWIKLAEYDRIPTDGKYINPRITYDGEHWWLSVCVETEFIFHALNNDGIGIDIGIKDLAICSDGIIYKNINKSQKVRKLRKRKRRLQRKVSKKYLKNKKGVSYKKTCNTIKSEKKLLKLNHRLTNIQHDYLHQTTSEIINRKPKFIVLEDLNVKGMLKNRHLAKAVQEQCFYEFYRQVEYKCIWNNIEFITADRFYPSSKMCSCCGNIKKNLTLSDRTYICDICGLIIDRDFQASVNLKNYYYNQ